MTPEFDLQVGYVLDARGRMVCTREPDPLPAPRFVLVRGEQTAWAAHASLADDVVTELAALVAAEPPGMSEAEPILAARARELVGGDAVAGPTFAFPETLPAHECAVIERLADLERHFRGWTAHELPERSPIIAILDDDGAPVSVCFCARKTDRAAAAGVETASAYRGRGYAPIVTGAWAAAIRASGRVPGYSTFWDNAASRAVARKLGLVMYATMWSLR